MDWVRNNRFLAGFIAVMVIGVGVLGYFLYSTQARYDQVSQEYATQVTELKRLEKLDPYPDEANLKRFGDQKAAFAEAVTNLQKQLAGMASPIDKPLTPTDFQNRLREIVGDVSRSANQAGVALPEKFYMGFEQYQAQLPDASAMALLTAQLADVEQLMRILINKKVDKLVSIKRAPVAGESGAQAPVVSTDKPKAAAAGADLVSRNSVEIGFIASPSAFRETLDQITEAPKLFVTRALTVRNENEKGPTRGLDASVPGGVAARPPGPPPGVAAGPGEQPLPEKGPPPLRYVVGQEKVEVVMNIEMVRVLPPR